MLHIITFSVKMNWLVSVSDQYKVSTKILSSTTLFQNWWQ